MILHAQGEHEIAVHMLREVLDTRQRIWGAGNAVTLSTASDLGLVLRDKGNHWESESLLRETVRLRESVVGRDHPHTLTSVYHLAVLLRQQSRLSEATPLEKKAYDGLKDALYPYHPIVENLSKLVSSDEPSQEWAG